MPRPRVSGDNDMSENARLYSYIKGGVERRLEDGKEVRVIGNYNHPGFNENSPNYRKVCELEGVLKEALWQVQIQKQTYQDYGEEYASGTGGGNLDSAEKEIDKAVKMFQEIGD